MLRTEREYGETMQRLNGMNDVIRAQETALTALGLAPDDVDLAMAEVRAFRVQLEEAAVYRRARERQFAPVHSLDKLGELLVALRIGSGLSQHDLATRLGVQDSQVSRDETSAYRNVRLDRAQTILDVLLGELGMELSVRVTPRSDSAHTARHPIEAAASP
jgi:ribosome-binding protein aMBF1 (putative translation factor)